MDKETLEKLRLSAFHYLGLTERQSEVFSCKALGMNPQSIAKELEISEDNVWNISSRMFRKLRISDRLNRDDIVQELGVELLAHYNEFVLPIVEHDALKMIANFQELDKKLGR